ncbi:MAG: TetR/AcrR family transcriptional regulator [Methylococcales bacterium]
MQKKKIATKSSPIIKSSSNRAQPLLDAAAKLFAKKGYNETTMRDISSEVGMLPGSLYYHFKSKQEILLAVYGQAVNDLKTRLESTIASQEDPWGKLELATMTHLEAILDHNNFARVMIGVLPDKAPEIQHELTTLRDGYETIFVDIINSLPLKNDVDKKLLRLMIMGAINSTQTWYHMGDTEPKEIGREFIRYIRESTEG